MSAPAPVLPSRRDPPGQQRTLILAAMADELAPLRARARVERVIACDGTRVILGRLGGVPVALAVTGEGAIHARRVTASLLERLDVDRLLVIGIAGGLSPGLEPGQMIVAERVVDLARSGRATIAPDWRPRVEGALPATVVSGTGILSRASDKRDAWNRTGAAGVAVVDLETAAAVGVATRLGIPCGAMRVVSDPAEEDLPFDLESCRDRHGGLSRFKVLGRALVRPVTMGRLWELRRRVRKGAVRLAGALEQTLERDGERG